MKPRTEQPKEHTRGAGRPTASAQPIRLGQGQDVLIVRSPLQRRLLEVLPTAEWRPHFSSLAKQLNKAPSSVWDAYRALRAQGLHAEVTLTIVPGLVEADRPVSAARDDDVPAR